MSGSESFRCILTQSADGSIRHKATTACQRQSITATLFLLTMARRMPATTLSASISSG